MEKGTTPPPTPQTFPEEGEGVYERRQPATATKSAPGTKKGAPGASKMKGGIELPSQREGGREQAKASSSQASSSQGELTQANQRVFGKLTQTQPFGTRRASTSKGPPTKEARTDKEVPGEQKTSPLTTHLLGKAHTEWSEVMRQAMQIGMAEAEWAQGGRSEAKKKLPKLAKEKETWAMFLEKKSAK